MVLGRGVGKGEGGHRQLKRELRLLSIRQRAVTLYSCSMAFICLTRICSRPAHAWNSGQTHSAASTPFQGFMQRRAYVGCNENNLQSSTDYCALVLVLVAAYTVRTTFDVIFTGRQNPVHISYAYLSAFRHSRHLKSV